MGNLTYLIRYSLRRVKGDVMNNKPNYCPEWFDLANYDVCYKFNRLAWWKAINSRKILLFRKLREDLSKGMSKDYAIDMLKYLSMEANGSIYSNSTEDEGLLKDSSIEEIGLFEYIDITYTLRKEHPDVIDGIQNMFEKISEYQKIDNYVDSEGYPYSWCDYDTNEFFPSIMSINSSFSDQGIETQPYISVDLNKNDNLIIDDFIEWLKEKRKQKSAISKTGRLTDSDLSKLAEYNVLPYIDLYMWGVISGQELTQYQIASLLFPDEYNVDIKDRLRAVTKPKAMALMNSKIDLIM